MHDLIREEEKTTKCVVYITFVGWRRIGDDDLAHIEIGE
jgi:hypothetical protein